MLLHDIVITLGFERVFPMLFPAKLTVKVRINHFKSTRTPTAILTNINALWILRARRLMVSLCALGWQIVPSSSGNRLNFSLLTENKRTAKHVWIHWGQILVTSEWRVVDLRSINQVVDKFSLEGMPNLVPRGRIPFGQHQGCKTSGIINVKMLTNRNLIGY